MPNSDRASRFIFSADGKAQDYYWVLGNKNKPPLLLIHGYTGNHSDLLEVAESLKEKYFVIVPDLPGWGQSERFKQKLSIGNYANYIKSLLDSLKISKVTIVGHCMGATLGIELCYKYPNIADKLILISTPYIKDAISEKILLHVANMEKHSPKSIRRIFFVWRSRLIVTPLSFYLIKSKSVRKKLRLMWHYVKLQPTQQEESVEENFESTINYNYDKVKQIKIPIHLIHGGSDPIISMHEALEFHQLIPNSSIEIIPNSGHMPPVESPQSLASLILKY